MSTTPHPHRRHAYLPGAPRTPGNLLREMLDDVAYELREDQQYDLAAEVFGFDHVNADSTDLHRLARRLELISPWTVGAVPSVLFSLADLYDAFVGLGQLFYLVRTEGSMRGAPRTNQWSRFG